MSVFEISDRTKKYQADLLEFMESHIYPAEPVYDRQMRESGDPHFQPPIVEELKAEARRRGLWNLFHPHPEWGPGLTNLEYAPLAARHAPLPAQPAGLRSILEPLFSPNKLRSSHGRVRNVRSH